METKNRRLQPVPFSALLLIAAASIALTGAMMHARAADPSAASPVAETRPAASETASPTLPALVFSEIISADEALGRPNASAVPPPPMIEILQAAEALVRAGLMEPPPPPPTLLEILQSVQALDAAGALPPPPTLLEILQSVRALDAAGTLPPPPTLLEILQSVQALDAAGALPAPPAPTLRDVLLAVQVLAAARVPDPSPPAAPPPPPPPPPPPAPRPVPGDGWFDATYTQQVWDGVNAQRGAAGLAPVSVDARLADAAIDYAVTMANAGTFSHTSPDGSSFIDRISAAGFPFTVQLGEILAMGYDGWPASGVVSTWMNSAGHREQIMEPSYNRAGLACYFSYEGSGVAVRCVMDFAAG